MATKSEWLKDATSVQRGGGDKIAVGKCPRCESACSLSSANKTGVTCRKCTLQFDGLVKINDAIAGEIRDLHATGDWTQRTLGKKFDLSQTAVGRITRGEAWPDDRLKATE